MKLLSTNAKNNITINDHKHLHVRAVDVFTGDDDYNETDLVEITTVSNKLVVKKTLSDVVKKSELRIRGEPGVRMYLESEDQESFILSIGHHKGQLLVDVKRIEDAVV